MIGKSRRYPATHPSGYPLSFLPAMLTGGFTVLLGVMHTLPTPGGCSSYVEECLVSWIQSSSFIPNLQSHFTAPIFIHPIFGSFSQTQILLAQSNHQLNLYKCC